MQYSQIILAKDKIGCQLSSKSFLIQVNVVWKRHVDKLRPRQIPEGQYRTGDDSTELTKRIYTSTGDLKEKQTSTSEQQTGMRDRWTKFKEKKTCTSGQQTDTQTSVESNKPMQKTGAKSAWVFREYRVSRFDGGWQCRVWKEKFIK